MSPVLPFDIFTLIIDIAGENEDTHLLKVLALVSYSFLQICRKYLFATIKLENPSWSSSKRGFVKLLQSRPDLVKFIRKLTYKFCHDLISTRYSQSFDDECFLLSSLLPNFLRSIPRLNRLKITIPKTNLDSHDWKKMDSSLTSALLHLMHLPTINRIDLIGIENFPLSSLITCINLRRLNIASLPMRHAHDEDDDSFEIFQSEVMPKLREFHTSRSSVQTRKLLRAKMQDGRPAFNLMNLRRLSLCADESEDKSDFPYLLRNAKSLKVLQLHSRGSMAGLHDILSPIACTLKVLHLKSTIYFYRSTDVFMHTRRMCEDLEAMAGHNKFEALTYEIMVAYTLRGIGDFIGTIVQKVVEVLVKPGWSALRQVSFKVTRGDREELEVLRSLTDICLSHLSKLESVQVAFSCTNRTS